DTLLALSQDRKILLVFLRHFGCTFCREAVTDIAAIKASLDDIGVTSVFVHMSPAGDGEAFFDERGLDGVKHVSDTERSLYRAFQLQQGRWGQLYGLRTWIRGFKAGVIDGHGIGPAAGDVKQMPGMFLLHKGEILASFRHK